MILAFKPEFSGWGVVVGLLDVLSLLGAAADTNHPQELVNIWENRSTKINILFI
jgi:hypothetical protein